MNAASKGIPLLVFLSLMTMASIASHSAMAAGSSFAGSYTCHRTDANNTTSTYPLEISDNGNSFTLEWMNANGFPVMYGTAVTHPNAANLAVASFFDPKNASAYGVEFFEIKPDNSLQANWAIQSTSQVGAETCTKTK